MYRDIADLVYLLDVLVVVLHISHSNCWITYYCTRIEVSVLRAGRGRGGEVFFPYYIFFSKMFLGFVFFWGGGDFGVFGVPHAPTRGSRGVGKRYTSSYDHDL